MNMCDLIRAELVCAPDWDTTVYWVLELLTANYPAHQVTLYSYDAETRLTSHIAEWCAECLQDSEAHPLEKISVPLISGLKVIGFVEIQRSVEASLSPSQSASLMQSIQEAATFLEIALLRRARDEEQEDLRQTRLHFAQYLHDTLSHDLAYLHLAHPHKGPAMRCGSNRYSDRRRRASGEFLLPDRTVFSYHGIVPGGRAPGAGTPGRG